MDRPEWVLIVMVLSAGLIGATVSATVGSGPNSAEADGAEPIGPVHDVRAATTVDAGSAVAAPATPLDAVRVDEFRLQTQQEFDRSTFRVHVQRDGDARWQYRHERPLETEEERAAFEQYAERVRTQETGLFRDFRNQTRQMTAAADGNTEREMTARNVSRDAGVDQTPTRMEGYVELSFEWTNFGQVEDGSVQVGDVFEGGLFLGESQSLIFVAGDGLQFESVDPEATPSGDRLADSQSVTWTGEQHFAHLRPRSVFQIEGAAGGGSSDDASMLWLLGGGVIGLLLVAALVITRYGGLPGREHDDSSVTVRSTTEQSRTPTDDQATAKSDETDQPSTIPEEPLSDDQRVEELLEEGGGRLKQSAIVEETEWSKSKVSMLLSEMEEEGQIRKIQVGRENIIALDGHEPEAASSPFDDVD